MNGPLDLGLSAWIKSAMTSFPVPLSPVMKIELRSARHARRFHDGTSSPHFERSATFRRSSWKGLAEGTGLFGQLLVFRSPAPPRLRAICDQKVSFGIVRASFVAATAASMVA